MRLQFNGRSRSTTDLSSSSRQFAIASKSKFNEVLGFFTSGGKIQKPPNWNVHTMMPRQLAEGLRRRPKGRPPRPILEQLPSINTKNLNIPSPYEYKTYILPNISFRFPQIASAKVSFQAVEFHHPSLHRGQIGPIQTFNFKHIDTGFGFRHAFICNCGRPVLRLYYHSRRLACRHCIGGIYSSQAVNQNQRPVLQAARIADFLDSHSRLFRRTRERLTRKLGEKLMRAQGKLGTEARNLWE